MQANMMSAHSRGRVVIALGLIESTPTIKTAIWSSQLIAVVLEPCCSPGYLPTGFSFHGLKLLHKSLCIITIAILGTSSCSFGVYERRISV